MNKLELIVIDGRTIRRIRPRIEAIKWIGYVLRRERDNLTRMVLDWNLHEKRKFVRPKITWRRTWTNEARAKNKALSEVKRLVSNRVRWNQFVEALHSSLE